jgi:hypothetical protein
MNRVITKLPEGKPPFIGIVFSSQESALTNSPWLFQNKLSNYTLHAHEAYGRLTLEIQDANCVRVGYYRMQEYDSKEYKLWRAYTNKEINFGHCYMEGKELKVARLNGIVLVVVIRDFRHQL